MPNSASNTDWAARGNCLGQTHLFFSPHTCSSTCPPKCTEGRRETGRFQRVRAAKQLCNGALPVPAVPARGDHPAQPAIDAIPPCPVREECREWALAVVFPHGIVGGMSEKERKEEIRRRAALRR